MFRWSVHALVVLYTVIWPGTVNGTYLDPLTGTNIDGDRCPLVDQITALIAQINKQEDRLQTLETQLAEHAVALAEKDRRIDDLQQDLEDMKWRAAPSHTPTQTTSSKDRNIGAKHQDKSETNQSGIDQRFSDQNRSNIIIQNGTTLGRKPAKNRRIRNTDESYDFNLKGKKPDVITGFGQPLTMKQQEKRVDNTPPERYAFSLSLSRNTNVVKGEIIRYDIVMLDLGNGYSHGNGIYEVPASGVYVFTWSTTSGPNNGGNLYTEFLVNGMVQLPINVDSDAQNFESATGLIVTSVNTGDHIYIRSMSASQMISSADGRSTFSGWRLF